ncbi:hypothetical protein DY000_02031744, partial [Brassica cretica]
YPKSGTTWLKALTVALLERSKSHSSYDDHPLLYDNPHGIFSASRRLLSTHMPLHAMHETLKHSSCKIVYVCRDVKDTLISLERFCNGTIFYGPFWEHLVGYWRRSLEDPKHVLFMRYEEMKAEPHEQIKRLADFLGFPFTKQEGNLSSLEVNKTGKRNNLNNKDYFRKGEVGDSKNYLTPEMEKKIDMIIQEKLQGSGLKF